MPRDHDAEDRQWLTATACGDTQAFRRLFDRHHVRVYRFLLRAMRTTAMAEEVLNETFLAVWRNAARYEGRSSPLTWLLAIAHNKAMGALRKRKESAEPPEIAEAIADEADTPDITAQKGDKSRILRRCIDALSPDHRTILDLVYYQERSIIETAVILDIPEGTVKTRMFHARKKLSELLRAQGVDRGWP